MNKFLTVACGLTVVLSMSGCVYAGPPQAQVGYEQGGYDGYYDGAYGAYSSGYWSNDGYFYYRGNDNHYRRDDQRHFRREQFHGGAPIHAEHRDDRGHQDHRDSEHSSGNWNNGSQYPNGQYHNKSGQGGSNRYQN